MSSGRRGGFFSHEISIESCSSNLELCFFIKFTSLFLEVFWLFFVFFLCVPMKKDVFKVASLVSRSLFKGVVFFDDVVDPPCLESGYVVWLLFIYFIFCRGQTFSDTLATSCSGFTFEIFKTKTVSPSQKTVGKALPASCHP